MRKIIVLAITGIVLLIFPGVIAWGYPLPVNWEIKFHNVEKLVLPQITFNPAGPAVQTFTVGDGIEDNWGIALITSIIDRGNLNTVVWSDGTNGEKLTAMFWGLEIYQITAIDLDANGVPDKFKTSLRAAATTPTGFAVPDLDGDGTPDAGMTVWLDDITSGTYTPYNVDGGDGGLDGPADRISANLYPTVTDGIKQADFVFRPGIALTDPIAITQVDTDVITLPISGDGAGYMDVIPGSGPLADFVNSNGFATPFGARDVRLLFNFRPHPDPGLTDYGWDLNSEDPIIGSIGAPPPGECRVTAGGVEYVGETIQTVPCTTTLNRNGRMVLVQETCAEQTISKKKISTQNGTSSYRDTWGGQAGAQPGIDGNWTHHRSVSPTKSFLFHSNSLSEIVCSDCDNPPCTPAAANATCRQIDFKGNGKFTNQKGYSFPTADDLCFKVHLEDIGEPGHALTGTCTHIPGTPINNATDCASCADYYEIRIFGNNSCSGDPIFVNGNPALPTPLGGYFITDGNVQMHPENN